MSWDTNLSDEQKIAASHTGSHARLLAGPGTGKTYCLARRIAYLVTDKGISPSEILATTFTRAAAFELRKQVSEAIGDSTAKIPTILTLHSFSLRQLVRNAPTSDLPQPLRIADDYEERYVIIEDLKDILNGDYDVDKTWDTLALLSADWQTLKADQSGWETKFPEPRFITAWHEHRNIYGYTIRAELVYQLKKAVELNANFQLEGSPRYFIVDEYQDLNPCDLAVIKIIAERGAEVYGAGDDDQSIYGFRKAYPQGIRMFSKDYKPSADLTLEVSRRCDRRILDFAHYVTEQDLRRVKKPLRAAESAGEGVVQLHPFANQEEEARGISKICRFLQDDLGYAYEDMLILLRQDYQQRFSTPIRAALEREQIPVETLEDPTAPLDEPLGREVLCMLRLLENPQDDLAWRTLLEIRHQGIGRKTFNLIYEIARSRGIRFAAALNLVAQGQEQIPRARTVQEKLQKIKACLGALESRRQGVDLTEFIDIVTQEIIADTEERAAVKGCLGRIGVVSDAKDVKDLLLGLQISLGRYEQDSGGGEKVRIMTMHQAKGLTSPVVIIAAAEDEYIPGKATGLEVDDERRLLYVSLTRAKNHVYVTYCNRRGAAQRHTGRNAGTLKRTLTRFLRDIPSEKYDRA